MSRVSISLSVATTSLDSFGGATVGASVGASVGAAGGGGASTGACVGGGGGAAAGAQAASTAEAMGSERPREAAYWKNRLRDKRRSCSAVTSFSRERGA